MEISSYIDFTLLPLLAKKRLFENEIEGRNIESWGVKGRITTMALHFPFLNFLSYSFFPSSFSNFNYHIFFFLISFCLIQHLHLH
jgi:hypothetical protein